MHQTCPNSKCEYHGLPGLGNVIRYGFARIKRGRRGDRLGEQLELLRCHYNFIRTHMALKFGTMYKTPAMQAGLTDRPLTFRTNFMVEAVVRNFFVITVVESQRLILRLRRRAA